MSGEEQTESYVKRVNNRERMKRLLWVVAVFISVAVLAGAYWFFTLRFRESTDNAYVVADSARISSRVPGTVLQVMVENDVPVERGQILLVLDYRDYQAVVDQTKGALAKIEGEIQAIKTSTSLTDTQTEAHLQEAKAKLQEARDNKDERLHRLKELQERWVAANADLEKARRDSKRFDNLFNTGVIAEEQRDTAHTNLVKAKALVEATNAEIAAVRASLQAVEQEVEQAQAQLQATLSQRKQVEVLTHKLAALQGERQEAEGKLQAAQLNLSYCTIPAPISGYIAQKNVQVGDRVQTGQPLMAVVPLREVYVEANLKETQLKNVRLGQPVTIKADVYPAYTYYGKVDGIRAGTGASFSLLPPENATGNWIKVVQRVPVKISLDEPPPAEYPLRIGFSLHVTISTRNRSGGVLVPLAFKPQ
ncbi:MAG: HlyD family efflux transporter periplasmic adaptor subunit [Syntrophobacteria bacterium]|jgi:membrane fusion protein (multidrug efflux system)